MIRRTPRRISAAMALGFLLVLAIVLQGAWSRTSPAAMAAGGDDGRPRVLEAPIEGPIDPVTADWVEQILDKAEDGDYDAVVFTIDTPGGLSTSMDSIIKDILAQRKIPVFGYVAPDGARAASAGAYIMLAVDVAGMSPSTNIGSATPINGNGSDIGGDLKKKVINDAVAKSKALARTHDRNEQFAEEMVTEAQNIGAEEALAEGVIEYIASDLDDLLAQADGSITEPKGLTVDTKDATVVHEEPPWTMRVLKTLIDPNVLFLLFAGGLMGLAFELTHPGAVFPGVAGAIMLIVALYGFQVLPATGAGVVLLVFAAIFFVAEIFVSSFGVLGIAGAVCLFLGGVLLFDRDSAFAIDIWMVGAIALAFAGFFVFVVRKVMEARRGGKLTGDSTLVGQVAVAVSQVTPDVGRVQLSGTFWSARTIEGVSIAAGEQATVVDVDGLTLMLGEGPPDEEPTDQGSTGAS